MKFSAPSALIFIGMLLYSSAHASMSNQDILKACSYVMASPNPGFQDSVPFTSDGKVTLSNGIYSVHGKVIGLPGKCSVKSDRDEALFRFENFSAAKKTWLLQNASASFAAACYNAISDIRKASPGDTAMVSMNGEPKLNGQTYILSGSILGLGFKCRGVAEKIKATFDDPGALSRLIARSDALKSYNSKPNTIEQAILNYTGKIYYPVGNDKYYYRRDVRFASGDKSIQVIMIYAPTLDSRTWGQCSVVFPGAPLHLTATMRDRARPGEVAASAYSDSRQFDVYFQMSNNSTCTYQITNANH